MDPVVLLREFGAFGIVLLFVGWILATLIKSFVPRLVEAIYNRIEAGTRLVEITTATVKQLPDVIAQSGKETREAIASFEKAVIASEARILDTFSRSLLAIKDEIFDDKQAKIERGLGRLARSSVPDSDPPPINRQ